MDVYMLKRKKKTIPHVFRKFEVKIKEQHIYIRFRSECLGGGRMNKRKKKTYAKIYTFLRRTLYLFHILWHIIILLNRLIFQCRNAILGIEITSKVKQ